MNMRINFSGDLTEAVKILQQGGVVIFPTDTVWGIGCRFDDQTAVEKVYQIRKRPVEKAVPVLVSSLVQAKKYFHDIPAKVEELISQYWPGGITVVYEANTDLVLSQVRGGGQTIGLRMPNKPELLTTIDQVGVPILGPSANFSGAKTPTQKSELDPELLKLVDYVMDGECGGNISSTVIDCTKKPWEILRQGMVEIDKKYFS